MSRAASSLCLLLSLSACGSEETPSESESSSGGSSGSSSGATSAETLEPTTSGAVDSTGTTADPTTTTDPTTEITYTVSSDGGSSSETSAESSSTGGPIACPEFVLPSEVPALLDGDNVGNGDAQAGSCGGAGAPDVVVEWVAPAAGRYRVATFGSTYDTVLYARDTCDGAELACNDDAGGQQSAVDLDLAADQSVVIVLDGFDGDALGEWDLRISLVACDPVDLGGEVPVTEMGSTTEASDDLFSTCGGGGAPDREFLWTAPATSNYSVSTLGSNFDTVVSVRDGASCDGPELACNDEGTLTEFGPSEAVVALAQGQQVLIGIDGYASFEDGDYVVEISDLGAFAGDCCAAHGDNGCDDDATWQCVCGFVPECCSGTWNQLCVGIDNAACGGSCALIPGGSCCAATGEPGCDSAPIAECVCGIVPECCDVEWTAECAQVAGLCAAEC